ncbi:MAG: hypothetical protein ACXQS8_05690, partial [Candidatus Helarchaeales archaeon]
MHSYAEIPDDEERKIFFPINKNVMTIIRSLGYEYYQKYLKVFFQDAKMLSSNRCKESILTIKECIQGSISEPSKTFTYSLFPPLWSVRSDLHAGTTSLLFGDSVISAFCVIEEKEIKMVHVIAAENGIPITFWFYDSSDDIMQVNHPKYGIKFRELPMLFEREEKLG